MGIDKHHLKKALFVCTVLGFGIAAFLRTKKGKEMTANLKEDLAELYDEATNRLSSMSDITREKYNQVIERLVEEYSAKKDWALHLQTYLNEELKCRWLDFVGFALYRQVKMALKDTMKPTEKLFDDTVEDVLLAYAKVKELNRKEKNKLRQQLQERWSEFKRNTTDADKSGSSL